VRRQRDKFQVRPDNIELRAIHRQKYFVFDWFPGGVGAFTRRDCLRRFDDQLNPFLRVIHTPAASYECDAPALNKFLY
jgi:hypothetical protein